VGRRRNLELGHGAAAESQEQEWYPRWVWRRFEAGEMDAVLLTSCRPGTPLLRSAMTDPIFTNLKPPKQKQSLDLD
jgi:hypothetical protein